MRKVLDITFSGDEYYAVIASNHEEAVSALRNDTPHIALIDAHLGNESGYDLCRQVKSALPHVKVLLLTSKQRPYDAEQGTAAGADDYFDKPFDSQKLLDKVRPSLRRKKLHRSPSPLHRSHLLRCRNPPLLAQPQGHSPQRSWMN
jgi:DNA-binding response OmpR family regulator